MEKENKYTTSDLYLTAYLKLKGFKMSVEKNNKKATFIFDRNDEIIEAVTDYLNESGNCEPLLYANSIKNLNISDFIKLCLIFNEYNDRIQTKHIRIINLKELLLFLEHSKKDAYFFPFMIMFLNNHFTIFVEYENEKKNYRLKLKYKNNDISVFKSISEENLFHLFHLSKKKILDIYL